MISFLICASLSFLITNKRVQDMSILFNPDVIKIYQPLLVQIASERFLLDRPAVQFHAFMHTPALVGAVSLHYLKCFKDLVLLRVQMYRELLVSYGTPLFSCTHCCTA